MDGFKTYVAEDLQVLTATTSTLNITMEVGELVQQITVSETIAPITVVETSEVSTNVEERVVMDLPLQVQNGRRQAENFIFLTPGVAGDTFSKSYNGSPDLAQVAMVDGIAFSNAEVPGRFTTFAPPFESVEEFKVSSTLYPAELGRGFGVTNYKIKSGTNDYHGNAFEFLRNEKLDASGFFAGSTGSDPAERVRRHHWRTDHQEPHVLLLQLHGFSAPRLASDLAADAAAHRLPFRRLLEAHTGTEHHGLRSRHHAR